MYIFSMILLVIFAVIGLCAFFSALADCACRGRDEVQIVLQNLSADNAEARIRRAARICRQFRGSTIVCICESHSPACEIARLMQKEYPFMEICEKKTE